MTLKQIIDFLFRPVNWRDELQDQITDNISMRSQSIRRIGDSISETPPYLEGVYKVREVKR